MSFNTFCTRISFHQQINTPDKDVTLRCKIYEYISSKVRLKSKLFAKQIQSSIQHKLLKNQIYSAGIV